MNRYAEILIDMISNAVDRPFHYRIFPEFSNSIKPGMQVTVPFGSRSCQGYVLRVLDHTPVEKLRDITAVVDPEPLLTAEQLALIHWLAMRYYCRKIDALHALLPASFRRGGSPFKVEVLELVHQACEANLNRAPVQQKAVRLLKEKGPLQRRELIRLGISAAVICSLEKKNLIRKNRVLSIPQRRTTEKKPTTPRLLSEAQAECFNRVCRAIDNPQPQRILLHGITASGKTEIYLQGIARCLELGKTALILVPEISLTPQMIEHFEGRFPGRVAVLHSRIRGAEKNRQWQMILSGEARVVLGARSAIFAPLNDIGLIVIDEEHETTYKQEEAPRYHARDVAWWRARRHRAVLLLGSATPSLESYYQASIGNTQLLSMKERVTPTQLPPVTVVDMRRELKEGHRHIFSRVLLRELEGVLERDEQALLFINRRGFAGFVLCRECGFVVRCPSCDVSMTLHLDSGTMRCHYCGHEQEVPQTCPQCGGHKIRYFSAGTQRVEEEMKKLYPDVSLIRMDSDTTGSRNAHNYFYRHFREGKASILIGTQMIAKGLDFPNVTLVGVVAADTALNLPDFRAPERTFQLITQVAGRTARGPRGGKVIVQTYHPSHYSIRAAAAHDYNAFFEEEIEKRRMLGYPPFADMIRFLFSGEEEETVMAAAAWFTEQLSLLGLPGELLGPAPASLYRIKGFYRIQTILRGDNLVPYAPRIRKIMQEYHSRKPVWPVRLAVDFNPQVVL